MRVHSLVFAFLFASIPALGIEVYQYSALEHDRFANDASFVAGAYDLSGVGRSTGNHWVTMISDEYFITAEHFRPSTHDVRFYYTNDPLGGFEDRTVDSTFGMEIGPAGSDIWLGRLTSATSASVTSYELLEPDPITSAELLDILTVGIADEGGGFTNFRVGTNQINAGSVVHRDTTGLGGVMNSESFYFTYDPLPLADNGESVVEVFDSGAPTFVVDNGALKLIGIHSELADIGPTGPSNGDISYDSYVGAYGDELRSVGAIPEPGSALLFGVGSAFLLLMRRKRQR
ncbi:MAG: PEP-CTERM sorting domain-containing protein [Verrucomicrobiales bacterium]|nr:PEP-CTERM sorting domain-containing protein [Verrucomicrobiales bacterium]